MSAPPPPPPHGEMPRSSGLPPGKYDIFVIPEHSAGSGFLYLPSLKPNVNSFFAGFASALILVALFQSMAPAFRAWWESFQGLGNMGMTMIIFGVGFGAWALGRTQKDGPSSSSHHQSSYSSGGGAGYTPRGFGSSTPGASSPNGGAQGGPPPRPPPHGSPPPPPPPGGGGPPPQSRPQSPPHTSPPPPPPPPPPSDEGRPPPQARPQSPPHSSPPPPPPPPPDGGKSPPQSRPHSPPMTSPPPPQEEKPKTSSQRPTPQPSTPKPQTPKGSWEKAREETRKKEEERKAKEAEQKRREEAVKRLAELRAKEAKQRQEREKEKERKEKEEKDKKLKEEAEKRRKEMAERLRREREEKAKEEQKKTEAAAAAAAVGGGATRVGTSYAYSSVGERTSMWPNGRPPQTKSAGASPTKSPHSPEKNPPAPTARTYVSSTDGDAFSYRPYDHPRKTHRRPSVSSFTGSDASWAQSHTTSRTSPPPSVRGPYTTKDPDKIVIEAVYLFMNQYSKTPASQLVSGVGSVTDGLILRITSEGLFIDDDVRGVPQREWDVKAWTLKLVEVWCPPHCLSSSASAASNPSSGPKSAPHLLYKMATSRRNADRDGQKVLTGDEADIYLTEMMRACKDCCRLGLCDRTFKNTNIQSSAGQTGTWKQKGLHILRATVRDQEGKRYMFVMSEQESWKLAFGLQRLRGGTQVRQLGVAGMIPSEARGTLEMLGWAG
ncbi:hypothetical protein EsDP_00003607 [Epichloe bromicola]|uniref:Proline-rich protein RiP-15 n=1 Tax=Epichloe bromicola TaxID=79588 RepID=A0ABQ0CPR1_9HYPO